MAYPVQTAPPAAFTPDLLARGIAWRPQEKVLGGLSLETRRLLGVGGKGEEFAVRRRSLPRPTLRLGNRLVRRRRGRTYFVEVTEGGLAYDGERFGSLRIIASKITGTRWSEPKFFGLVA